MSQQIQFQKYWQDQSKALSRRINLGWYLQTLAAPLLIVSCVCAILALLARRGFPEITLNTLALVLSLLFLLTNGICLFYARRKFESHNQSLVRLETDLKLNAALSSALVGVRTWPCPPDQNPNNLKWHLPKAFAPSALSCALLCLSLVIPVPTKTTSDELPSRQPQTWSQLDSQLEQLSTDAMVNQEDIEQAQKSLDELRAQEEEEWFSHSSLEATDRLEESQNSNLSKLDKNLNEATEAFAALTENGFALDSQQKQKLTEQFEQALQDLQSGTMKPNPQLLNQLTQLDPKHLGKISPEQMQNLKEGMSKLQDSVNKACEKCNGGAGDDWEEQLLAENRGEEKQGASQRTGSGEVKRGPGHDPNVLGNHKNPLSVGEISSLNSQDLSRALPGDLLQLQNGKHTVYESSSQFSQGGTAARGKGGERIWRESLDPNEQQTLKKFFD